MLPFKNRLLKRKDFEEVYRKGNFFSCGNVTMKIKPNGLKETRIGFSVGLKFSKRAVERNRIKRQLRDLMRPRLAQIKGGLDIVVLPRRRNEEKIDPRRLKENVEELFIRADLAAK